MVKPALRLARRHLADYSHHKSLKKFTQPQLFACLILKAHWGCTCRRCEKLLILMPAVREAIELLEVPRFTTLQTFADRPEIAGPVDGALASIGRAALKARPQDAAADGTGPSTARHGTRRTGTDGACRATRRRRSRARTAR